MSGTAMSAILLFSMVVPPSNTENRVGAGVGGRSGELTDELAHVLSQMFGKKTVNFMSGGMMYSHCPL